MAVRCFCPPDSVMPRSPTSVCVALRERLRRPCRAARRRRRSASARSRGRLRRRVSTPNAMFSAMVSENRNGSCGTNPIAPRSSASGISRTSTPSMKTVPGGGSCSRGSRLTSVDLPEPVAPTIAAVWPASMRSDDVVEHRPLVRPVGERQVAELDRAVDRQRRGRPRVTSRRRSPAPRRAPRACASTTPCRAAACS